MEDTWLTLQELCEYLKINRTTVYKWVKEKRIPAYKVANQWRFLRSEIDEWVRGGDAK